MEAAPAEDRAKAEALAAEVARAADAIMLLPAAIMP